MIGASVADVITQFRAVQIVIAKDQLDQVCQAVEGESEQLVIVADSQGRLLESNSAFEKLVGRGPASLSGSTTCRAFFAESDDMALRLKSLQQTRRSWRGDVMLRAGNGPAVPLHVRADAITARRRSRARVRADCSPISPSGAPPKPPDAAFRKASSAAVGGSPRGWRPRRPQGAKPDFASDRERAARGAGGHGRRGSRKYAQAARGHHETRWSEARKCWSG